jgi:polyphosphate kinase 2 (PPK2 family)
VARLEDVDLAIKLSRREEERRLAAAQRRLLALRLQVGGQLGGGPLGPPVCLVFEGWDASGKGGAIRRVTSPLDPRHVNVATFAAPNPRELRHHFLWRFWPELPGWGGMTVLDRSWYGRVLVERVEKLIDKPVWRRAYEEIVRFERTLCEEGMVLVKFWLHISEGEQLRRFQARERDPLKRWKLTDEDWRNRKRRKAYERAVGEMLERTDHRAAPWRVIAAEDKRYARVSVLETAIAAIEAGLRNAGLEPLDLEAAL